ncbi:hypothetical protein BV22DRAFT_314532 [Leucogyrophana mollusca]|uniref:Uncharacterized protein n=1 Tax=Leucogyrophana mollusca TaxID=85980 RepID=A0ACB8BQ46_9AGAM|nr:hypothetical protein BV22DRAFT_314532 [Leucogyrophana mollusca]
MLARWTPRLYMTREVHVSVFLSLMEPTIFLGLIFQSVFVPGLHHGIIGLSRYVEFCLNPQLDIRHTEFPITYVMIDKGGGFFLLTAACFLLQVFSLSVLSWPSDQN